MNEALKEWLVDRPEIIQRLAIQFPPGSAIVFAEKTSWVVGYNEGGLLSLSDINPMQDYDEALKQTWYLCPTCIDELCK